MVADGRNHQLFRFASIARLVIILGVGELRLFDRFGVRHAI
jgi:hypothetical protein